jgi:hypothetical protein
VDTKTGSQADAGPKEPADLPGPISWKATLWFLGTFVVGAYLTQLLVVGGLYAAERFLP